MTTDVKRMAQVLQGWSRWFKQPLEAPKFKPWNAVMTSLTTLHLEIIIIIAK